MVRTLYIALRRAPCAINPRPVAIHTNFPAVAVYFQQDEPDAAVVRRCLRGDAEAFEILVSRYQRVAYTVALRILGDREDARDATQVTFMKVFAHLDTYDPSRRFFSWMYRILQNECLNAKRARRPSTAIDPASPVMATETADTVENAERHRDIHAALMALPLSYREVIVLRHFAALTYEEIGAALALPPKRVKSRLHTARHHLAQLLAAWGTLR